MSEYDELMEEVFRKRMSKGWVNVITAIAIVVTSVGSSLLVLEALT